MFCPKCGSQTVEGQRFCKTCGTNIQLINDAIRSADSPQAPFGINVDELAKNAREFAESWKKGWHNPKVIGVNVDRSAIDSIRAARQERRRLRQELQRRNLPRPKEYLHYSWQHNLRSGLMSLLWGSGLGIVLAYLGNTAIETGLISQLEDWSKGHVHGLAPLVKILWLVALLPVLKGVAQIIYAAFFGESMATLSERFTVREALPEQPQAVRPNTAPVIEREPITTGFDPASEPPPSVTEHTTHIFEEAQRQAERST